MNLTGHRNWRKVVDPIETFPDAPTIRIMHRFLTEQIDEEIYMRGLLSEHPEELASWLEHSEPDLQEANGYLKELEDWLHARDLVAR